MLPIPPPPRPPSLFPSDHLETLASTPTQERFFSIAFNGETKEQMYQRLNSQAFINQLVSSSCVQIDSASPGAVCGASLRTVRVTGKGFTAVDDLSKLQCRFTESQALQCKDSLPASFPQHSCFKFHSQGFCQTPEYDLFMKTHCPKACGFCTPPIVFTERAVVLSNEGLLCRTPR